MGGLYLSKDVRELDAAAIAAGVSGHELMCRAAASALRELRARWPAARDLLVICGGGNNGGDGYVLARLAKLAGLAPRVLAVVGRERLQGDAARAAADCGDVGVPIITYEPRELASRLARCDVVVDALLGIGLVDDVRAEIAALIRVVNACRRPVLAIDVPSGLCADTGRVRGTAVVAAATVTFIARKAGLWMASGPEYAGEVVLDPLGIDTRVSDRSGAHPVLRLLEREALAASLVRRPRDAHKGIAGHVLIVGGGLGMPGAARLAGEAALRAGAGRVTVLAAPGSLAAIAGNCPELMVRGVDDDVASLDPLLAAADVVAIGPGLGHGPWAHRVFSLIIDVVVARRLPCVIDADALTLLAETNDAQALRALRAPAHSVLTPHPGEAARLLGTTSAAIQADRLQALRELQSRHDAALVLKGAGTLVSGRPVPWLCPFGNPAMAAPGMGDVLTGVIAALLGQGLAAPLAARTGVLLHALAGDLAADAVDASGRVDRGVLAGEVSAMLPRVIGRWSRAR
jgi:NAD(P)H-hydrate epimerase